MSCNPQNYNSRSAYDQHMLKNYHSPVWVQNGNTRTNYDLDLQQQYLTGKDRYIPNFSNNFTSRENQGQAPWNSFNNVMVTQLILLNVWYNRHPGTYLIIYRTKVIN